MNIERVVLAFAGSVILLSVALAYFVSSWWLLLTLFVGANLLQSSFTGFCPLAMILRAFGMKPGSAFPS
jgi:fatty acid desaturase